MVVLINGLPGWKAVWECPPLAAGSEDVEQGVEDGFPFPFLAAGVAAFEQVGFDEFSFLLGKITWVGFQREQPVRCCLVSKNRGRRSLPTF